MGKMQDMISAFKKSLNASLTKDSSANDIKKVKDFEKNLDSIQEEYDNVVKDKEEVTKLYIEVSKKDVGSKDAPKEDDEEPVTDLEDIAKEIQAQEESKSK